MTQPPAPITRSAEEGEALMARVHQSGLSAEDSGMVEQVIRMYCWVVFALPDATLSLQRLRSVLFGRGPKPCKPPVWAASSASRPPVGERQRGGELAPKDQEDLGFEGAGAATGRGEAEALATSKPAGGHRPGTGRLGADAYEGAERLECRHEEWAVGQSCPVYGQGTL